MSSPFPTEIVGCPFEAFAIITAFWSVLIFITLGQNAASVALTLGLSFLTSWLWGMYSWMVLAVGGGVILLGFIGYLIVQYIDDIRFEDIWGGLALAALGIGGPIAFYFFVVKDSKKGEFLVFWAKILAVVGVLGLVALFVWLAYRHTMDGGQGGGGGGGGRGPFTGGNGGGGDGGGSGFYKLKKNEYFHGTSDEAAEDIWKSGLWLSTVSPAQLWMTTNSQTALSYSAARTNRKGGCVLVLKVHPSVRLISAPSNTYYIQLDDSSGQQANYYEVEGVEVIKLLDIYGRVLKSR